MFGHGFYDCLRIYLGGFHNGMFACHFWSLISQSLRVSFGHGFHNVCLSFLVMDFIDFMACLHVMLAMGLPMFDVFMSCLVMDFHDGFHDVGMIFWCRLVVAGEGLVVAFLTRTV